MIRFDRPTCGNMAHAIARAERHHRDGQAVRDPVRRMSHDARDPGRGRFPLAADDVDVDLAAAPDERVDDRSEQDAPPQGPRGLAEDDPAHVPRPRVGQDLLAHRGAGKRDGLGAQLLGEPEGLHDPIAGRLRQAGVRRGLHVRHDPFRPETIGQAATRPDELAARTGSGRCTPAGVRRPATSSRWRDRACRPASARPPARRSV